MTENHEKITITMKFFVIFLSDDDEDVKTLGINYNGIANGNSRSLIKPSLGPNLILTNSLHNASTHSRKANYLKLYSTISPG